MYSYRTKTYIAGDWDNDIGAIKKLYEWNDNDNLSLHFIDVHSLIQSYDTSLPCSIKSSLRERLNISKLFVLIVGNHTKTVSKGSCRYCKKYDSSEWRRLLGINQCDNNKNVDYRSFIQYECEMAKKDYLAGDLRKIVVLYNSIYVDKSKCPDCIRELDGVSHIPMKTLGHLNQIIWDYQRVKKIIDD